MASTLRKGVGFRRRHGNMQINLAATHTTAHANAFGEVAYGLGTGHDPCTRTEADVRHVEGAFH